jgi:hypothetical protein
MLSGGSLYVRLTGRGGTPDLGTNVLINEHPDLIFQTTALIALLELPVLPLMWNIHQ